MSHPFMAVTKAVARPRAASGSARGKTYSSEGIQARLGEALAAGPLHELGDAGQLVGPEEEVEVGHPGEEALLLLLGDAARHGEQRTAPRLVHAVTAERREELLLRLLADGAGVEDDEFRVLGVRGGLETVPAEQLDHAGAVRLVHLAAEGMDEDSPPLGGQRPGGEGGARYRAKGGEVGHARLEIRGSSGAPSNRAVAGEAAGAAGGLAAARDGARRREARPAARAGGNAASGDTSRAVRHSPQRKPPGGGFRSALKRSKAFAPSPREGRPRARRPGRL